MLIIVISLLLAVAVGISILIPRTRKSGIYFLFLFHQIINQSASFYHSDFGLSLVFVRMNDFIYIYIHWCSRPRQGGSSVSY